MGIVIAASAVMLFIAIILTLLRIAKGPSMLDRTMAFDVLTSSLVAAVALQVAWKGNSENVIVLVVFATAGFIGSVTIARFAAAESPDDRRLQTKAELEAEQEAERKAEELVLLLRAERAARRAEAQETEGEGTNHE